MKCAVNSLKRTGIIVERSLRSAEVTDLTDKTPYIMSTKNFCNNKEIHFESFHKKVLMFLIS